ncbi:hypothetical protein AFLA70_206g001670, partial [Aspergillus flavus AF70]
MITQGREEVRKGNAKIAFNVWEEKKSLIIKLYREEGWPLKQVIKMTCSHNFSPSESQLRSRLKRWRVTKSTRLKARDKCDKKNRGVN